MQLKLKFHTRTFQNLIEIQLIGCHTIESCVQGEPKSKSRVSYLKTYRNKKNKKVLLGD